MSKYKYRICKKSALYWFELLPNNSNTQPVARSSLYNTYGDTIQGIEAFKQYMANNEKKTLTSEIIHIKGNCFQLRINFGLSNEEYLIARTCEKYNLKKAEKRLRNNYSSSLRYDLYLEQI